MAEPLEQEAGLHGEVEVDVMEVLHHKVIVLLRLRQHVLLHVKVIEM